MDRLPLEGDFAFMDLKYGCNAKKLKRLPVFKENRRH